VALPLLALGGWFAWRWYTTPTPPSVPLEGVTEETAEVVRKATQQVRQQPRSGKAWGELGLALIATHYNEQALVCLQQARRFDPKQARWAYWQGVTLSQSDPRAAIGYFRDALALADDRDERVSILFALALALVEEQDVDEAVTHLRSLAEMEPDSPRVHFGWGLLALARQPPDHAAARDHLGRLTDSPLARKRAYALLAGVVEDAQQAKEYSRLAAELPADPEWPTAFDNDLAPYKPDLWPRLSVYRNLEAQGRRDDALAYLRSAAAEAPDEGVCFTLGTALMAPPGRSPTQEDLAEAVAAFRQALRFNPRNAKAHFFLAALLLQRGENEQALASADAALGLQGQMAEGYYVRGQALKRLGRRDEAVAALREAVLRGPEFAVMHQALGEALAESGQPDEGLRHLEDAVRLAKPKEDGPRKALEAWRAKAKGKK
jgi:tetratricopeptide (TPR) repeat protein